MLRMESGSLRKFGIEVRNSKRLVLLFFLLAVSFASYDLVVLYLGTATSLFSIRVDDGWRWDEPALYLVGVGKTILFDPYLKEHAADLTLRPAIPTALFTAIYWLCGRNLDLSIVVGHTVPPLVSCLLLYLIGMRLTGSRSWAIFAMLLAVGHFVYSPAEVIGSIIWGKQFIGAGLAGPDLYLLKSLLGDALPIEGIMAPTQFTRLFSPSLTLPFFLLPLWMLLRGGAPAARGALIAANLYVYPHNIIVLGVIESAFWLRDRRPPKPIFFVVGALVCVPFILLYALIAGAGTSADMYSRVGQTHWLSPMWFFVPFFAITTLLVTYSRRKDVDGTRLAFTAGCLASAILIWSADSFLKFPQVHLVGLRIFAYVAPLTLACGLKELRQRIASSLNMLMLALVATSHAYAGWTHRFDYADFPADGFPSELSKLPAGSVVMTDVAYEVPYVSTVGDRYSYLAAGIVSAASNAELLQRFAIVARVYGWSTDRLHADWSTDKSHGVTWDIGVPIYNWIYHLGAPEPAVRDAAIDAAVKALEGRTGCELLQIYRVDYIRFRQVPPVGVDACTVPATAHILRVVPAK